MAGKEVRAGKAFVEITLKNKLAEGLKKASAQLKAFAAATSALGASISAAGGAILAPLGMAVTQFAEAGSAVADMSARIGMSAESLSALGYAAGMTGASMEDVEKGVRKMQQTVVDAANGSQTAAKSLAAIGLSAADLVGLSPEQQMQKIADGLSKISDPAMRTAAALDIFGKGGASLIPMMANGSAGLAAFADQARKLGLVMSTEDASAADALGDAMDRMWGSMRGATLQIGAALAPAVTQLADTIAACVSNVTQFIQQNRALVVTIAKTAVGVVLVGGSLLAIGIASLIASYALQGFAVISSSMTGIIGRLAGRVLAAISSFASFGTTISATAGRVLTFSRMGMQAGMAIGAAFGRLLVSGAGSALSLAGSLASLGASAASSAARIATSMGPALWSGISMAANATVSGVRSALSAGTAAVGALVRGWTGEIGMFTNRVNTAFWTIGAKTREYVTTLKSGGLSQALALAKSDFRSLMAVGANAFRGIGQSVFSTASTLRTAIVSRLTSAWQVVRASGDATFSKIRSVGVATANIVGRAMRGVTVGMGRSMSAGLGGLTSSLGALGGLMGGTGVGAVFTMIPMVTTAIGGLVTAVASLLSPFGLVLAAVTAGVYAWTTWSESGRSAMAILSSAFGQIYQTVKQVFGGIGKALAAGDIKLAGEILWAGLKTLFYQGASALAQVWPFVATGAGQAWQYITDTAGSAVTWLAGLWAQLPDWITGALGSIAGSFSAYLGPALDWIAAQFSELFSFATETFGGISNAIAAGDWGLAFDIAWASIKMAWTKGVNWITSLWSETTTGLAMMFDSAVTSIRQVWGSVITWIAQKMISMYDGIVSILEAIAEWDPTGMATELVNSLKIDAGGAMRILEEDNQRANAGLEKNLQQRNDARGQALLDQQKAAESELQQLRQQRDEYLAKAAQAAGGPDAAAWDDKARKAQDDLTSALDKAAALPGMFDTAPAMEQLQQPAFEAAGMAQQDTGKGFTSKGTFSGAALWGLAAGGINERTAKAAESTAANTRQLVDAARRNRLVFG